MKGFIMEKDYRQPRCLLEKEDEKTKPILINRTEKQVISHKTEFRKMDSDLLKGIDNKDVQSGEGTVAKDNINEKIMGMEFKQKSLLKVKDCLDHFPSQYHPIYLSAFIVKTGSRIAVPPTTANESEILKKLNSELSYRIPKKTTEATLSLLQTDRRERLIEYQKKLLQSDRKKQGVVETLKILFKQNER